jgi:hypothetical protein
MKRACRQLALNTPDLARSATNVLGEEYPQGPAGGQ